MKSIKIHLKTIAVLLSVILLFQSCSSTYSGSYTLMDAFNSKLETRITTINHEKFEYSKIDTINGKFVGQKLYNNQLVNEPLDTKAITKVELKKFNQESRDDAIEALGIILGIVVIAGFILSFTIDDFCMFCDDLSYD